MLLAVGCMVVGLVLLVGGADVLIRGVSALAEAVGVPPLVIGLTVVAFGTSTPELVLNAVAAAHGETDLAFGNLVGSCTINIGWVLALTALVRPLSVEPSIITREIPMMLLGTAAVVVLACDHAFDGAATGQLSRGDGLMLLLLFCVFLYYTVRGVLALTRQERREDPFVEEVAETMARKKRRPPWALAVMTGLGLAGVAGGGRLAVFGAVSVATAVGISEAVIGLTIVSFGTTLPELVTGVVAARRGQSDVAIGNVVGSNIFNLLFVGGVVSTIRPVPVPKGGVSDLLFMAALSALLLPVAIRGPRKVTRAEGGVLLAGYLGYMAWRTAFAGG